jgi:hypothetical protein
MNDPQLEGHMASYIARRKFLAMLGVARLTQDEELDRTGDKLFVIHLKRLAFFFAPPPNTARQAGLR